jgi:hypothetical protein
MSSEEHRRRERESGRRTYQRNKLNPEWVAAERERNRIRMRIKRADPAFRAAEYESDRKRRPERYKS